MCCIAFGIHVCVALIRAMYSFCGFIFRGWSLIQEKYENLTSQIPLLYDMYIASYIIIESVDSISRDGPDMPYM